ncbi:MAG: type II secretion system protein, partial [Planctomycetota bacterium]
MPANAARTVPQSGDCPGAPARRRRAAFTLIELLVVVAILTALVIIVMPAISGVLEMSRQSVCLSNHRAIVSALQSYHTEHKTFPYNYGDYGPYKDDPGVPGEDKNQRWALACIASYLTGSEDTPVYLRGLGKGQFPNAYMCPGADQEVYDANPDDMYHACYWTNVAIRRNRGFGDLITGPPPPGRDDSSGGKARIAGKTCENCNDFRSVY